EDDERAQRRAARGERRPAELVLRFGERVLEARLLRLHVAERRTVAQQVAEAEHLVLDRHAKLRVDRVERWLAELEALEIGAHRELLRARKIAFGVGVDRALQRAASVHERRRLLT